MLTVGSCFAGIGGFDRGFELAGSRVIWSCEVDANCRRVLAHHWPGVPRFRDVRTVTGNALRAHGLVPDVLVGGFPCQGVSIAGKRLGLADERSALFFEFALIAASAQPRWIVVENTPGLLSSAGGRDMGTVLGVLADIGYGLAWRVLDAQYFGVAQRRRRVFIVGCLGDGRRAAQVLLEPEGGGGDPPTRDGQGTLASALTRNGVGGGGGADDNSAQANHLVPAVSNALCSNRGQRNDHNEQTFLPVAYRKATTSHGPTDELERWEEAEHSNTLDAGSNVTRNAHAVVTPLAVRRLTPLECLRLQGFPDDWLDLKLADSIKYRMVGNAVAVPVVEWIGRRILANEEAS